MIQKSRAITVIITILCIAMTAELGLAGKGGKGKPQPPPTDFQAGSVEFANNTGDGLASDGGGAYVDDEASVQCVHDPSKTRCDTGYRSLHIALGSCSTANCESPWGNSEGDVSALISRNSWWADGQSFWPLAGETLVSDDLNGGLYVDFHVDGVLYTLDWRGPNGEIVGTGFDDVGDGIVDRTVLTASSEATVRLYRTETVVVVKGKKVTTTIQSVLMGEFADMPFSMTFRTLDYSRPEISGW